MVWQFPNEPHRIRQPIAIAFADIDLSRQRIHRGKQPVLDEHVVPRERLQQARLPRVRVAHQRGRREIAAALPLIGAMLGDVLQPLLERGDLAADRAAVGFELGFARSPEADTAADARQVAPHARQARQQILELRQLDLQLRFVAARARREDVENDLGAVHDAHAEAFLQFHALYWRETFIEKQQGCICIFQIFSERFDLALPQIEVWGWGIDTLDGLADDLRSGRIGKPLQLLEVLVHVQRIIGPLAWGTDEKRALYRRLDLNQLPNTALPQSGNQFPQGNLAVALQLYSALP